MKTPLAPLFLLALASTVRSEVHTVGPPGSGSDFTTIQAAIDAAADGDTVLVAPGSYAGFVVAKPILVIGAGSGETTVTSIATSGWPLGAAVSVTAVPAGEVAVVAGMAFEASDPFGLWSGIALLPAEGTVVLHDMRGLNEDFADLEADGIGRLVLSRLSLSANDIASQCLRVQLSRVWLVDSQLMHSPTTSDWPFINTAAKLIDTEATFAGCRLAGADVEPGYIYAGGNAVDVQGSQVVVSRTAFLGGDGTLSSGIPPTASEGGFGAALTAASTLFAGLDATLQGGLDGWGLVEQDPVSIEAGSTFIRGSAALPTLSALPARAGAGDNLALALHGSPGASGALFVSLAPGAGATIPGLFGEVFLDLAAPIPLVTVTLDAAGESHLSLLVPVLPEPAIATFQWAALASVVEVSNPAYVSVQ